MNHKGRSAAKPQPKLTRREKNIHHEGTKFTKFKSINIRTLRVLRAFVVSPLFFVPFALFAIKSSPLTPVPGSHMGCPYNLFYVLLCLRIFLARTNFPVT